MSAYGTFILNALEFSRLKNAVAAGQTTQTSSALTVANYNSFMFIVLFGAITATGVPVVSVQGSTDGTNYNDLAGTGITITASTDDNKMAIVEIHEPPATITHLRVQVTRPTANAVLDGIVGIRGRGKTEPVTQGTGVHASSKVVITPAVGTA